MATITQLVNWQRFRSADCELWLDREDWPAGDGVDEILVFSARDGFHIWWRSGQTPPGAYWTHLPPEPAEEVERHRQENAAHWAARLPVE